MLTDTPSDIRTLRVNREVLIHAPIDIVFETLLEPQGQMKELAVKIEPWPGGRWFRDLGNNTGHLWGHVQVIKPPTLLELTGPMFMSYPAISHIQYRLTEEAGGTRLAVVHQAMGLIAEDHQTGVVKGWEQIIDSIRVAAENKPGKK
jgi:uncharacterized protein YndB with AHSA1/START domain